MPHFQFTLISRSKTVIIFIDIIIKRIAVYYTSQNMENILSQIFSRIKEINRWKI